MFAAVECSIAVGDIFELVRLHASIRMDAYLAAYFSLFMTLTSDIRQVVAVLNPVCPGN
jgi:hypothetical protein